MFFEIQPILVEKRPKAFLLENVKQLRGHDQGRTLKTIIKILHKTFRSDIPDDIALSEETRQALPDQLNYHVEWRVLRAGDFGAAQSRERIYIFGFDKNYFSQTAAGKSSRKRTPRECTRLQGSSDTFIVNAVFHGQIYKQLGNSVSMNVIEAIASEMVAALSRAGLLSDKETAA